MKPTAWYDPTNGAVSTDKDSPLFTPLGQVWPLYLEEQQITTDCPQCEYHKNRTARWRAEAYKQGGHDVIELPWVGLTDEEIWKTISRIGTSDSNVNHYAKLADARAVEAKLKEKNQ